MFDFTITKESLTIAYPFFSLSLYLAIFVIFKNATNYSYKNRLKALWCFILIFSIAAFYDGDFYHYKFIVQNFNIIFLPHLEKIYIHIILFVNNNYLLFRLIVWGGALLITSFVFKRLNLGNLYLYIYVFFILYIIRFAYVRAALAYAFYFFGFSFLIKQYSNKCLSYILGLSLIYISSYFHNSAILLVAMTLLLIVPLNKKTLLLTIVLLPSIYTLFDDFFNYLLTQDNLGTNGIVSKKINGYTEGGEIERSVRQYLMLLGETITFYGYFIYILVLYYKNNHEDIILVSCFKIVMGVLFIAFFLFILGTGSQYLFPRIMEMVYIPMVIIICRSYELGLLKQVNLKNILYIGFFVSTVNLLYSTYLTTL